MKVVFIILLCLQFCFFCIPNLLNRTVGYKKQKFHSLPKRKAFVKFHLLQPESQIHSPKNKAVEILKKAVLVSIHNSGNYKQVVLGEIPKKQKNNSQDHFYNINIAFRVHDKVGYYDYDEQITFLYIPPSDENSHRAFWPSYVPGMYPCLGMFPFISRAGVSIVYIDVEIVSKGKKEIINILKQQKYSQMIFGIYRTKGMEEAALLACERALEELTMKLKDIEL